MNDKSQRELLENMSRRRLSVAPSLSRIIDVDETSVPEDAYRSDTIDSQVEFDEKSPDIKDSAGITNMDLPIGWRVVPSSRARQYSSQMIEKLQGPAAVLRYENIYSGERFTVCPVYPAHADLPSRVFEVVCAFGQNLLIQHNAFAAKLIEIARNLNKNSLFQGELEQDTEITEEANRIMGMISSQNIDELKNSAYSVYSLFTADFYSEVQAFAPSSRKITRAATRELHYFFDEQIAELQDTVTEISKQWHSGSSLTNLLSLWSVAEGKINSLRVDLSKGKFNSRTHTSISKLTKRKRVRRGTIHIAAESSSPEPIFGHSKEEDKQSFGYETKVIQAETISIPEQTAAARQAAAMETREHQMMRERQLGLLYCLMQQKDLITTVQNELNDIQYLASLSLKRRTQDKASDDAAKDMPLSIYSIQKSSRKNGHSIDEHHQHIMEKEVKEARNTLNEIHSDLQSCEENSKLRRFRTRQILSAFNSWDGKAISITNNAFLAPIIRGGLRYQDRDYTNQTQSSGSFPASRTTSDLLSLAHYHESNSIRDQDSEDEDLERIQMIRKSVEMNLEISRRVSESNLPSGSQNGTGKKQLLLLRELSLLLKDSSIKDENKEATSLKKQSKFDQASVIELDPVFQKLHVARSAAMMSCLKQYGTAKSVQTMYSLALLAHEEEIATVLNPSWLHSHIEHALSEKFLLQLIDSLRENFYGELREISSESRELLVNPEMMADFIQVDKSILKSKLPLALSRVIRVLKAQHKFRVKKLPSMNELKAIELAAIEDVESEDEGDVTVHNDVEDIFAIETTVSGSVTSDFNELDRWDHDHRLSRVNDNNMHFFALVMRESLLTSDQITELEKLFKRHMKITDKIILEHDSNMTDVIECSLKLTEVTNAFRKEFHQTCKDNGIPDDVQNRLDEVVDEHQNHLINGDGVESEDEDDQF